MKTAFQFEIFNVGLSPTKGSEQSGVRPCLIVETNAARNRGKTTIVVPFTSKIEPRTSFDIILKPDSKNGLSQISKLKFRQIRVVDKTRLLQKIGAISDAKIHRQIFAALKLVFDFEQFF